MGLYSAVLVSRFRLVASLAAAALLLVPVVIVNSGCSDSGGSGTTAVEGAKPAASPSAGMKAHIDPETGEFLDSPPVGSVGRASPAITAGRPPEPAVEVPSPVPGGGVMIDLNGRFQAEFVATVGPDGKLSTDCREDGAVPDE
ncbi:MAG: post-PEP-CTERM-1 domain-containing protein [Candidatus Binatia bacterium]